MTYRKAKSGLYGIAFLLFVAHSLSISAQSTSSAQAFTIEEAVQFALSNNKNIQNARFDEYIAQASVNELLSVGLPQLTGSADLNYYVQLPTSILPGSFNPKIDPNTGQTIIDPETGLPVPGDPLEVQFGFPWQSTAGFSLQQLVFDGTYFIGVKAAKTFVELSEKNTLRTQEDIALSVTKAYYQALIAEEQLNLIQANIDRLEKLYTETKILNETGFAEKIDVDRLQITYTNLEIEKSKMERYLVLSKDMLKFQMGMPVADEISLSEKISDYIDVNEANELATAFDPANRIEYSILETQLKLENYNLRRYKAGYYPSLFAFGSYQWNAQRNEFNFLSKEDKWFPISVVGLQLNVPIFDGFKKKNQIQQSRLAIRKIENNFDILTQSINLELKSARSGVLNSQNNLEVYQKNKELAERVFNVANVKYKEGVGSSLEINDAEAQLKQASSNYLTGIFEYLMAKVELQKAKGEFSKYHTTE